LTTYQNNGIVTSKIMLIKKVFLSTALLITVFSSVELFARDISSQKTNNLTLDHSTNLLGDNYGLFTSKIFKNLKDFKLPKPVVVKYASEDTTRVRVVGDFEGMIREVCQEYNCSEYETEKIFIPMMYGESGGDNTRINYTSNSSGLFQHLPQYWDARVARILGPDVVPNIWDPYQQIKVSIHMFKVESQGGAWVASKCGYMDIQYGKEYTDKRRSAGNCWDPDNTMRVGG